MSDYVTLSCPDCDSRLEVPHDIDQFACAECGAELAVRRRGGIVALELIEESDPATRVTTDDGHTTTTQRPTTTKKRSNRALIVLLVVVGVGYTCCVAPFNGDGDEDSSALTTIDSTNTVTAVSAKVDVGDSAAALIATDSPSNSPSATHEPTSTHTATPTDTPTATTTFTPVPPGTLTAIAATTGQAAETQDAQRTQTQAAANATRTAIALIPTSTRAATSTSAPDSSGQHQAREWLGAFGRIYSGVRIYYGTGSTKAYGFEILGGSENCPTLPSGRGLKVLYEDGTVEWKDRRAIIISGLYFIDADDPALDRIDWYVYTDCP